MTKLYYQATLSSQLLRSKIIHTEVNLQIVQHKRERFVQPVELYTRRWKKEEGNFRHEQSTGINPRKFLPCGQNCFPELDHVPGDALSSLARSVHATREHAPKGGFDEEDRRWADTRVRGEILLSGGA